MSKTNKAVNAGVHSSTGFEFQKHCALYILFDNYEELKDRKYFICLEHHDDFLYCYQEDNNFISYINAYQAKKSSTEWKQGKILYEIIKKMLEVGVALGTDNVMRTHSYSHNLEFITNNSIGLNNGKQKEKRKSTTVNESTNSLGFIDLNEEVREKIKTEIGKLTGVNVTSLNELDNISMTFIDIPKQNQQQKDYLVGFVSRLFGKEVRDCRAALDTLLTLFRDAENTLNKGNTAKLMDESKRVYSANIKEAINIITTKSMAFDLWRKEETDACRKLGIVISEKDKFKLDFENSFDRFKDKRQADYQKIYSFVNNNRGYLDNYTDEIDCIQALHEDFIKSVNSQLSELSVKAAIFAAYIEVREML